MARFRAAGLAEEEDHTAFVRRVIEAGRLTRHETIATDGGVQVGEVSACRDPDGNRPGLFFHRVTEGESTKTRVHLDLHGGSDLYESEVARLDGLRARRLWFSDDRRVQCWTMADVEDTSSVSAEIDAGVHPARDVANNTRSMTSTAM